MVRRIHKRNGIRVYQYTEGEEGSLEWGDGDRTIRCFPKGRESARDLDRTGQASPVYLLRSQAGKPSSVSSARQRESAPVATIGDSVTARPIATLRRRRRFGSGALRTLFELACRAPGGERPAPIRRYLACDTAGDRSRPGSGRKSGPGSVSLDRLQPSSTKPATAGSSGAGPAMGTAAGFGLGARWGQWRNGYEARLRSQPR